MDAKDEAIIRVLDREKLSSRALSNIIDLPISTIHRRIQNLERRGIIKGYKALIDYEKTSRPISALLLINLAEVIPGRGHIPKSETKKNLKRFNEIEEIIDVQAADFDLVIKVRMPSLSALSELVEKLRSIEAIEETTSAIITNEILLPYSSS